ncbi:MAG: hypothetical protein BMS9Abin05_0045 [Rhodothermia bacterium]|nr:MAG: hypothetical protein BMS9Abin05_0045 [Rhodothermia bacterium]
MALYTHKDASLNNIDGRGYVFLIQTSIEDTYKGVFISERENAESLESLLGDSEVEFDGIAYRKTRGGELRSQAKSFLVDVKNVVTVSAGIRADFEVLKEVTKSS